MAQVLDKVLANKVSERIIEVENLTGITYKGLAIVCDIKPSYFRSFYYGTKPIAVQSAKKICSPFKISLSLFFDFAQSLPSDLKERKSVKEFYAKYYESKPEFFVIKYNPHKEGMYP